jgi:hypothetical protein
MVELDLRGLPGLRLQVVRPGGRSGYGLGEWATRP